VQVVKPGMIPIPHKARATRARGRFSVLLGLWCLVTSAAAAPVATNTALPISEDGFVFREQLVFMHGADTEGGVAREFDRFEFRTVAGYGITPKLAVFGMLPHASMDSRIGGAETSLSGIGDAAVFARYEVFRRNEAGRSFRVAPFAGLRLPTGKEGETGDGSLDVFGGLIVTVASTDWELDSQLRFDINREADGFDRGDVLTLESSLQYRVLPGVVAMETRGFLFAVLELSASAAARNRVGGVKQAETGGFQLFATPGLQYATRRWIADFGVKLPVSQDLRGTPLKTDYVVLTSLRISF
jgi:Putative MetA-pathway of phenol degradation